MSVPDDLLAAVRDRLFAAIGSGWAVKVRKAGVRVEGETGPRATVSLAAPRRVPATGEPDFAWFGSYPVVVSLSRPDPSTVSIPPEWLAARAAAESALTDLHAMGLLLPTLDDLDMQPRPAFDGAAQKVGVDWASFVVTYSFREPP